MMPIVRGNSQLVLCSLVLVAAYAAHVPQVPVQAPPCLPAVMTLEEHNLKFAQGKGSTSHVTHYVDLTHNARYAKRIQPINPAGSTTEFIYFNNNHTRYYHFPSEQICIETGGTAEITTCVLNHTTFNTSGWVGGGPVPGAVNIFTYQHENMIDTIALTPTHHVPVESLVYQKAGDVNQITKSSYFNGTLAIHDPSIFYLPLYCFNKPRRPSEDARQLLTAVAKNFPFIL